MYFYRIGYHSCEDSSYSILYHEKKFTHDEIGHMIAEIVKEMYPTTAYKHKWGDNVEISDQFEMFICTFKLENKSVAEHLVEKYGFNFVKFEEEWSAFGWASVTDKEDWRSYRRERDALDQIQDYLAPDKDILQSKLRIAF